jgi:hypothetical protein
VTGAARVLLSCFFMVCADPVEMGGAVAFRKRQKKAAGTARRPQRWE